MKLADDIYLVGSGNLGFNLSDDFDCHIYLIRSGDALALIEAGAGRDIEAVCANIRNDGLDPRSISQIFVTHYHADHAGGLRKWRELTGAKIHAPRAAAPALRSADAAVVGLEQAKKGGFYPADYFLEPCVIDTELVEGIYSVGDLKMHAFDTEGHCDGHMSFLLEGTQRRYLLSGDCLFYGGTIIIQNIPDCNLQKYTASIEKLASLEFDALLPGHLAISMKNGKRHADVAAAAVRSLGIPKQAVQV